ncbi:hypothetical protein ABZ069_38030 [Streptomyces microflavus]|uniref:hypothetical protein n=1 Tax=Streptomyces microflavus TaxID=1919 RepID=UPI0033BD4695
MSMSEQEKVQCVTRCFEGIAAGVERGAVSDLVHECAVAEFERNEIEWFADCLIELLAVCDPKAFEQFSDLEILAFWNQASELARTAISLVNAFTVLADNFKVLQMSLADITRENSGMLKSLSPGYSHPVALVRSHGHSMVIGGNIIEDGPNHFQAVQTLFQHLDQIKAEFGHCLASVNELNLTTLNKFLETHLFSQEWHKEINDDDLSASFGYVTMERKGGRSITTLKSPGMISVQGFSDADRVFIEKEFGRFTKKKVEMLGDASAVEGDPDHVVPADVAFGYKCRVEVTAGTGALRGRYLVGSISEAMHLLAPYMGGFSIEEFYRGTEQYALSSVVEFGQARRAEASRHSMQANGYEFDLQAGGETGTGSQQVHLLIMIAPTEAVDVLAANAEVLSAAAVDDVLPFFMLEEHLKIFKAAEANGLQHLLYRMTAAASKGTPLDSPLGCIIKTSQNEFEVHPYLHARKSAFDTQMRRIQDVIGDFRYTAKSPKVKSKVKIPRDRATLRLGF